MPIILHSSVPALGHYKPPHIDKIQRSLDDFCSYISHVSRDCMQFCISRKDFEIFLEEINHSPHDFFRKALAEVGQPEHLSAKDLGSIVLDWYDRLPNIDNDLDDTMTDSVINTTPFDLLDHLSPLSHTQLNSIISTALYKTIQTELALIKLDCPIERSLITKIKTVLNNEETENYTPEMELKYNGKIFTKFDDILNYLDPFTVWKTAKACCGVNTPA